MSEGPGALDRETRWSALGTKGGTIWLTGLSGSGKSTIALGLASELLRRGVHAYRLDGDELRRGLCRDLGFSAEDRNENIRRAGEVARILADSGSIVVASFISPYEAGRRDCRRVHESSGITFLEVFVDTPIEVCERRDPKGLYSKARAGEIRGFTGVDDPYERPKDPDLVIHPEEQTVDQSVALCLELLAERALIASLPG